MSEWKNIKKKIDSISSTLQLVSAMHLIATAKFRRYIDQAEMADAYHSEIQKILLTVIKLMGDNDNIPDYIKHNPERHSNQATDLLICIAGDGGLCGGFNTSVIQSMNKFAETDARLIVFGSKLYNHALATFSQEKIIISKDVGDILIQEDVDNIVDMAMREYKTGDLKRLILVYNPSHSTGRNDAKIETIFPFYERNDIIDEQHDVSKGSNLYSIIEPSPIAFIKSCFMEELRVHIISAILNNMTAEYFARMVAMGGAKQNASDMIDALRLRYNRTRQASITNELAEIISASESNIL